MARLKQTQNQIRGSQGGQAEYQTRGSQGSATGKSKPKKGKKRANKMY